MNDIENKQETVSPYAGVWEPRQPLDAEAGEPHQPVELRFIPSTDAEGHAHLTIEERRPAGAGFLIVSQELPIDGPFSGSPEDRHNGPGYSGRTPADWSTSDADYVAWTPADWAVFENRAVELAANGKAGLVRAYLAAIGADAA